MATIRNHAERQAEALAEASRMSIRYGGLVAALKHCDQELHQAAEASDQRFLHLVWTELKRRERRLGSDQ